MAENGPFGTPFLTPKIPPEKFMWVRKASDTFNFLRHVMRAILSVRPKCSHRCVSLKETPLKTRANPQAHNQKVSRANVYENEMVETYRDLNCSGASLSGSFFCVLSQEMRHINFFLGAQNGVFRVGAKKFMLKKFMCLFLSPMESIQYRTGVWKCHRSPSPEPRPSTG